MYPGGSWIERALISLAEGDGVDVDFEEEASSRNDGCLVGVVAAVAADVNVDRGTKAWQNDKLQNVATKKARATTRIESGTGTGNMLAGV